MQQISILGCGWLGIPLSKSLMEKGFIINGSTTSVEKISVLKSLGINAFQINLYEDKIDGKVDLFLEKSEILIIDIPPKLRSATSENFYSKMTHFISYIENSSVEKVIFISSISVFSDENSVVDEATIPNPTTESGIQLLQVEQLLQNNKNFQTTIIRFGGLIGNDRHPIHFLSGKKNIENPNSPINLIHQDDCIGIIEQVISKNYWNKIINAVSPFHPTRKEYYTHKAKELNIPLPKFTDNSFIGKSVLCEKSTLELKYNFKTTL